jgi:hypothetical protein
MTEDDIGAALVLALSPLVSGRVYWDHFPQPPAAPIWPSMRYTWVSQTPDQRWCGDGDEESAEYRLQIDIVLLESKGKSQLTAMGRQVKALIKSTFPGWRRESQFSDFDFETKTNRMMLDYSISTSVVL